MAGTTRQAGATREILTAFRAPYRMQYRGRRFDIGLTTLLDFPIIAVEVHIVWR